MSVAVPFPALCRALESRCIELREAVHRDGSFGSCEHPDYPAYREVASILQVARSLKIRSVNALLDFYREENLTYYRKYPEIARSCERCFCIISNLLTPVLPSSQLPMDL
jgi:hypothetical protein